MKLRMIAHIALFIVAFVVFYIGLGIGLQQDPTWGSILWAVALAIVVLNAAWMLLAGRRRREKTP